MHVVVVGNGIAGVTAALAVRRLQPTWQVTLVSGESTHHYSRPALMYLFMGHMRYQDLKPYPDALWQEQRITLRRAWVTRLDLEGRRLELAEGAPIAWDRLLLATGSRPNLFGWPGQELPGVQGLYDLGDLARLGENVRGATRAVVVGGGLIGIELAEMLHSRGLHVTLLARERSYWDNVLPPEESALVTRLVRAAGFDLRLETELKEVVAGPDGRAAAVVTSRGERLDCSVVGLTAGVRPNVELARGTTLAVGRGLLVDRSLRTNVPDVFAAGDCAELVRPGERNLVQQVWYTGKQQGECVGRVIAGEACEHEPGIWFNSAKLLDLEYQTYGTVLPSPQPGETRLWWERPDGHGEIGLRLVVRDGAVTGFNALGLRLRHRVCERWIQERASPLHVLAHLEDAHFDPELFRRHEAEIVPTLLAQLDLTRSAA